MGALILVPLSEFLHAQLGDTFPGIQGVVYGIAIIAVILLAPEGIYWKARDLIRPRRVIRAETAEPSPPAVLGDPPSRDKPTDTSIILKVTNLSKSFGGLEAVRSIDMHVLRGEILGVIGPNGAGKTTLFNLLNGFITPDSGEVLLDGNNIIGHKPYDVCAAGVGRTFQVVRPFRRMTVLQNAMAGAFVHAQNFAHARSLAREALTQVGLGSHARIPAGNLTNQQLRMLEIARALAGQPRILLLDETLAGLGGTEIDDMIGLMRRLAARGITIVIIEHTMQAMVKLVDRFVVLDNGAVLAEGSPDEITTNPAVIDAYLGKRWRLGNAGSNTAGGGGARA